MLIWLPLVIFVWRKIALDDNLSIIALKNRFGNKFSFTKEELFQYFQTFKPDIKETNFRWIVYKLRANGIIGDVKKGIYSLSIKPKYLPRPDKGITKITVDIIKYHNTERYLIWNSSWLNEFTIHQAVNSITIFEREKEYVEDIFYLLKDKKYQNIYINPTKQIIEAYISENQSSIVILPMISRSPIQVVEGINFPTLEKILIDVFTERDLFYAYQGEELKNIFRSAFNLYCVNYSKLFNYSKRRNKFNEIVAFLQELGIIEDDFFEQNLRI